MFQPDQSGFENQTEPDNHVQVSNFNFSKSIVIYLRGKI